MNNQSLQYVRVFRVDTHPYISIVCRIGVLVLKFPRKHQKFDGSFREWIPVKETLWQSNRAASFDDVPIGLPQGPANPATALMIPWLFLPA